MPLHAMKNKFATVVTMLAVAGAAFAGSAVSEFVFGAHWAHHRAVHHPAGASTRLHPEHPEHHRASPDSAGGTTATENRVPSWRNAKPKQENPTYAATAGWGPPAFVGTLFSRLAAARF